MLGGGWYVRGGEVKKATPASEKSGSPTSSTPPSLNFEVRKSGHGGGPRSTNEIPSGTIQEKIARLEAEKKKLEEEKKQILAEKILIQKEAKTGNVTPEDIQKFNKKVERFNQKVENFEWKVNQVKRIAEATEKLSPAGRLAVAGFEGQGILTKIQVTPEEVIAAEQSLERKSSLFSFGKKISQFGEAAGKKVREITPGETVVDDILSGVVEAPFVGVGTGLQSLSGYEVWAKRQKLTEAEKKIIGASGNIATVIQHEALAGLGVAKLTGKLANIAGKRITAIETASQKVSDSVTKVAEKIDKVTGAPARKISEKLTKMEKVGELTVVETAEGKVVAIDEPVRFPIKKISQKFVKGTKSAAEFSAKDKEFNVVGKEFKKFAYAYETEPSVQKMTKFEFYKNRLGKKAILASVMEEGETRIYKIDKKGFRTIRYAIHESNDIISQENTGFRRLFTGDTARPPDTGPVGPSSPVKVRSTESKPPKIGGKQKQDIVNTGRKTEDIVKNIENRSRNAANIYKQVEKTKTFYSLDVNQEVLQTPKTKPSYKPSVQIPSVNVGVPEIKTPQIGQVSVVVPEVKQKQKSGELIQVVEKPPKIGGKQKQDIISIPVPPATTDITAEITVPGLREDVVPVPDIPEPTIPQPVYEIPTPTVPTPTMPTPAIPRITPPPVPVFPPSGVPEYRLPGFGWLESWLKEAKTASAFELFVGSGRGGRKGRAKRRGEK